MLSRPGIVLPLVLLASCARDTSITRGADGAHDWQRRLERAVPIGMSRDSAAAVLGANGFSCHGVATGDSTFTCDKQSSRSSGAANREWQVVATTQGGRVTVVKGSTEIRRP